MTSAPPPPPPPPPPPETVALVLPFADEEDVVTDAALAWIDHHLELERIDVAHTVLHSCGTVLAPRPAPCIDVFESIYYYFYNDDQLKNHKLVTKN